MMARLQRLCPANIPQHIIQRGNNRQPCFTQEQDFITYTTYLKECADKFEVKIHAWVFMTNHVHLLCTPKENNGVSKMMQGLGRKYVHYFNKKNARTGTLWEGRFKSCIIESDAYLLQVYRYIELNPVRARMVTSPEEYKWSSYQINALGKNSDLCSPHPLYLSLGATTAIRLCEYMKLFMNLLNVSQINDIRNSTNKNLALGSELFKKEIEHLTGRRVFARKRGRSKMGSESN